MPEKVCGNCIHAISLVDKESAFKYCNAPTPYWAAGSRYVGEDNTAAADCPLFWSK